MIENFKIICPKFETLLMCRQIYILHIKVKNIGVIMLYHYNSRDILLFLQFVILFLFCSILNFCKSKNKYLYIAIIISFQILLIIYSFGTLLSFMIIYFPLLKTDNMQIEIYNSTHTPLYILYSNPSIPTNIKHI